MIYFDTSVIIKLFIREKYSSDVSKWITNNNKAIPLTVLHDLELLNAIHLKQFRKEIGQSEVNLIIARFNNYKSEGIFFRPQIDMHDLFDSAVELSVKFTARTGSRSLDILHVASALAIGAKRFFTFDKKQSEIAVAAGFKSVDI